MYLIESLHTPINTIGVEKLYNSVLIDKTNRENNMATHNELGRSGEEKAAAWLLARGYEILHRNWRHGQYEIDIIARKNLKLHFIEVKTRKSSRYGYPEESVTKKKFRYLKLAADEYLYHHPGTQWIQYDILSIVWATGKEPAYFLLEDVFM